MTVSTSTSLVQYNGDGVTTVLTVPFYFLQNSHLLVQQTNNNVSPPTTTTLVLGTGYTVTGAGNEAGGSITLTSAAPTGYVTAISRNVPSTQLIHYVPNDAFPAGTTEAALDQLTMLAQQVLLSLGYTVSLPASAVNNGVSSVLPYPQSGQFLAWNNTGNALVNASPTGVGPGTVTGGAAGASSMIATGTITDLNVAIGAAINASKLSFLANGTHAVARSESAKGQDWISVKDWGATGNGTTDDTTAIQNCINDNPGSHIIFPPGTYLISSPLVISNGQTTLNGFGRFDPVIRTNSATADIIDIACGTSVLSGIGIYHLTLDATSTKTAGWGINITASAGGTCYWVLIDDVQMTTKLYSGLNVQSAYYLFLQDITVNNVGAGGVGFSFVGINASTAPINVYMRDLRVTAGVPNGSTYGMLIDNYCQGFYGSRVSLESGGIDMGLYIKNTSGVHANAPMNLFFDKVIADTNNNNGILIGDCTTVRFTDSWSTSAKNSGVFMSAGIDVEFKGHMAINNGKDGFTIQGGSQIRILGGVCDQNSATTSNTNSGVNFSAGVTDFTVRDVDFFRQGSSARHYADIYVAAGASDRYVLSGNRCRGGVTYLIFDGGTGVNKWIQQNDGFNPRGASVTQPSVPASGTAVNNATGQDCMVYLTGGTVTSVAINATLIGYGATSQGYMVPAGGSIQVFYSSAPTWKWFGN